MKKRLEPMKRLVFEVAPRGRVIVRVDSIRIGERSGLEIWSSGIPKQVGRKVLRDSLDCVAFGLRTVDDYVHVECL